MFKVETLKGKNLKKISIAIAIILLLVMGITILVNADDSKDYVVGVMDAKSNEEDAVDDGDIKIHKQIVKDNNSEPFYDSKTQTYKVTVKDINEKLTPEIAMIIDSSYSVGSNDSENTLKANAISLAQSIYSNCQNAKIQVFNCSGSKSNKLAYSAANLTTITNAINNLTAGDGNDLSAGITLAKTSFTAGDNIDRYIVIFTDTTDDTRDVLRQVDAGGIKIVTVSVEDIMSNSYVENGQTLYGRVQMIYSEDRTEVKTYQEFDPQIITDFINVALTDITITDTFSQGILDNFDFELITTGVEFEKTQTGYVWTIDRLKRGESAEIIFKLTLKDQEIEDSSYLYHNIASSDKIVVEYKTNRYESETLDDHRVTLSNESTPIIQIRNKYQVTIKAVSEEESAIVLAGVKFNIVGTALENFDNIEPGTVIYNQELTTDKYGTVTIDDIRTTGNIKFEIKPSVDIIGYADTDMAEIIVTTNKFGQKLDIVSEDWKDPNKSIIDSNNRNITINFPISTDKFIFNVELTQADNKNVVLPNSEFRLIAPKRDNANEFIARYGITDENGKVSFAPSIMTEAGTYDYILSQQTVLDGYYAIDNVTVRITFDNNGNIVENGIQIAGNPNVTGVRDNEKSCTVNVTNESEKEDCFGLELTLTDASNNRSVIEGAEYDIVVTRTANGEKISTTYPNNITNVKGKINIEVPGSGYVQLKITQTKTKIGYDLDKETKIITLNRVDGTVQSITQAYNEVTHTGVDANAYSAENKVLVNLTNTKQSERNILKLKLVDSEEQDVPIQNVEFRLTNNMTSAQYTGTTDAEGILEIQLPTEAAGIYNYRLESVTGIPSYYNQIENTNITVEFNSNGIMEDVSDAYTGTGNNPILSIDDVEVVSNSGYADHTALVTLEATAKAENTYYFQVKLVGPNVNNVNQDVALEGATYDLKIKAGDFVREIKGRKTNVNGIIETKLVLDETITIEATQTASAKKYKMDPNTKEIILHYNRTTNTLTKDNNTDSTYIINGNKVIYNHRNSLKTTDDIFLDFTVSKVYEDNSSATQLPLWIHQDTENPGDAIVTFTSNSKMLNGDKIINNSYNDIATNTYLDVYASTDNSGTVMLENLKVSGVPNEGEAFANILVDELEISYDQQGNPVVNVKNDMRVKYHVTYRYNQYTETMELTNVEITQGIRHVKEGTKSFQGVDTSLGYQSYVTSTLYANVGITGNLIIDVLERDELDNTLDGALYDITIQQPNNIGNRVYRNVAITDGKVELPGVITNLNTTIVFTPVEAPIGYALSKYSPTLIVTGIDTTGEVHLTLQDSQDTKLTAQLPENKKIFSATSDESGITEYTLILTNNELDTFTIKLTAIDKDTQQPVKGYSFKIESSNLKRDISDATDVYGETKAIVGPNYKDTEGIVTYTISKDGAAEYYKDITDINMLVRFTANREVPEAVKSIQTDSGYGELANGGKWYITEVGNKEYDVAVEIYVEKQDPIDVEVETLDRVKLTSIANTTYTITPNLGTSTSTTDDVSRNALLNIYYPSAGKTVTYTLTNISIIDHEKINPQELVITYDENGDIDQDPEKTYAVSDNLEIDTIQGKYIKLKTKANPRVVVNVTTKDYITGNIINEGSESYTITDPTGETTSNTIADGNTSIKLVNGFVKPNQNNIVYNIKQDSVSDKYELQTEKNIKVEYNEDGHIINATKQDDNDKYISIDSYSENELNITIYNEPRQGIYLENYDYYTNEPISGGVFTFVSELDTNRTATLNVANDGKGSTLGSRLGEESSTVKYTVKQTGANYEYAKLKDFEIEVTYNSNREITGVRVVDNEFEKWVTASYIQPSSQGDLGYNGNDKGIIKLVVKSEYSFRINITNLDRFDNDVKVAGTSYSVTSTIPTNGATTTDTDGKGTAYIDRTEASTRVVYTIKEEAPGIDYQNLECETVDVEVTFDEDGYVTVGDTKIANGQGEGYAVVSDVNPRQTIKDKFTINLTITNIPKFRVNITNLDREDTTVPIEMTEYSLTSEIGNSIDTLKTDSNGKTLARVAGSTIGKEVVYTIHEDRSASEYQDLEEDIKIKAIFNTDGKLTNAEVIQGNRYGTVTMIQNPENTFEQMTAEVVITNNPIFNINILNIDRTTNGPLVDTEYEVIRDSDEPISINKTDNNGLTDFKAKSTLKDNESIYTIHEITSSAGHQAQEQDIKVKVKFDVDGHITDYSIVQGNDFATLTKEENPATTQENFRLHLTIINNKYVDIHISNVYLGRNSEHLTYPGMGGARYKIEAYINETDNQVENSQEQSTDLLSAETNFQMTKGLANKTIKYVITETYNKPGFEKLPGPVNLLVTYDNEGKIVDSMTSVSEPFAEIIKIDVTNFGINMYIISEPTKEFNIRLSAFDIYDSTKGIEGVKAEAYLLTESFNPDQKYTISDITTDSTGEAFKTCGQKYTDLNKTSRILRVKITDVPDGYMNFARNTDKAQQDNPIIIDVVFSGDEGRVVSANVRTNGYDRDRFGWYPTSDIIQVIPNGYGVNVKLNLYPVLQLKLHSQDYYTQDELNAGLTLSTSTYPIRDLGAGDVVQQGWIGWPYVDSHNVGNPPYGTIYSANQSSDFVRFARTETVNNGVRYFYLYENSEPNGYNRYRPEDPIKFYNGRRIGTIKVQYDTHGKILSAEVTEWRSSNSNTKDYIDLEVDNENNTLEVNVKYLRTTTMTINVKDGVSGANISSIGITPFNGGNRRYNGYGTSGYETTNGDGFASWKYWDVNFAETTRKFDLGTFFYGTGFGGYWSIGNIYTTVNYNENGIIKSATAKADNADIEASWEGTNLHLEVKMKRKFIMLIDSKDIYDTSLSLSGQFTVSCNEYLNEIGSAATRSRFVVGAIHPGETVTYQIKENSTISGYIPMDVMKLTVVFKQDGTIASATVNSEAQPYFDVLSIAELESGKRNENTTDLQIRVKKIPSFITRVNLTDEFYPSIKLQGGQFTIENSKGDVQNGTLVTDAQGTAVTFVGPIYPNETISYTLKQTNSITNYFDNNADMKFDIEFTANGYIKTYNVTSTGNDNKLSMTKDAYVNRRFVNLDVSNKPKYIYTGINNIDELSGEGINDIQFEITAKEGSDTKTTTLNTQTYGTTPGVATGKLDDVIESTEGREVEYTVKQLNVPNTYRRIQDFTFKVYYNNDGSILYDDHTLPSNVDVKVYRKGQNVPYVNGMPVQVLITIKNDNAYDLIIKDEDKNYAGLGVEGTKYDVSIAGDVKTVPTTDLDGIRKLINQRDSGEFEIRISEVFAGTGYRTDLDNNTILNIKKGTVVDDQEIYSLELLSNSNEDKATVEVNEEKGTITVTFKNETKHEVGLYKYDINTNQPVANAGFRIKVQEVDASGNKIGDQKVVRQTEEGITLGEITYEMQEDENGDQVQVETEESIENTIFMSNENGLISLDLGTTPQNRRFIYSYEEVIAPEGYNSNANIVIDLPVNFDMYGQMTYGTPNNWRGRNPSTYNNNKNAVIMRVSNGDLPAAKVPYSIRVVTEDSETNKRINGSIFDIIPVKVEDGTKTEFSAVRGGITADVTQGGFLIEKGVINVNNLTEEGIIEVAIDQKPDPALGYSFSDKTSGTIKLQVEYTDSGYGYKDVSIEVLDDGGFGDNLIVDSSLGEITVVIKNDSVVELGINANYKYYDFNENLNVQAYTKPLADATFTVTSEIQSGSALVTTQLEETSRLTNSNGNTHIKLGKSYPGKTVLYTIKANIPDGYEAIDDIVVLVKFDSNGNIKYKEMLTSEDVARFANALPGETPSESQKEFFLNVYTNRNEKNQTYKITLVNFDIDNYDIDTRQGALPGAKYTITVEEEFGETRTWTATTNEDGEIVSPDFSGYGRIKISVTQNEASEGFNLSNVTQYLEFRRNKTTKDITGSQTSDNTISYNDNDPRDIEVYTFSRQRNGLFNITINKIDQRDNTRITDSSAKFELYRIEEQTVMEDVINENAGVQEDGTVIEPISSVEKTQQVETDLGEQFTNGHGQAAFRSINIPDEEGTYTYKLIETKAPNGYVADDEGFLIDITFERDSKDELVITDVSNLSPKETVNKLEILKTSSSKTASLNIKNTREEDAIADDEYSLDITNVDAQTDEPIEKPALFKVWLPDSNNTEVYTETAKSYLGPGKLEYCFIEQGKDYSVRLTHMKIPTLPTEEGENVATVEYKFKAIVPAEGYGLIEEELVLTIEFTLDEATGEVYITDATSSNEDYLRINNKPTQTNPISTRVKESPELPISTKLPLSIDILNGETEKSVFKITYDPNESDDGIVTQNMPDPLVQKKNKGETYYISDTIPTRQGFEFGGWSLIKNRPADYQPGDAFNEDQDITLYAVWEPELYVKSTKYVIGTYENYVQNKDLEENEYNDGDKYIIGLYPAIPPELEEQKNEWNIGTTLDILRQNIETNADTIKLYDKDENELADDKLIGTEMVIEFRKASKTIRLTAIVRGDMTGDGILNLIDINKANKYIKNDDTSVFDTEAKWISFDTDLNKQLDLRDLRKLMSAYLQDNASELGN